MTDGTDARKHPAPASWRQSMLPSARRTEPPRDCRRPFGLSYAAMAPSSSMARPAAATSLVPMAALAEPVQALRDTWSTSAPEAAPDNGFVTTSRSEEHTSELQSLMRIPYAVFCLQKKTNN